MNLIIVESPTKARTLSRFLGKDYSVEATMGHIKDLPKSKIGVEVTKNFKPSYLVVAKKQQSIDTIINSAKKASTIYLATDPDREGEAIAQHVKEVLQDSRFPGLAKRSGAGKIKDSRLRRIVFHEITKEAVEQALKNPKEVNNDLVDAQIGRRVLDRLVGYKLSPLLWKKVRRGLSAGRVQTVTVRLIVEREREIQAFKPKEYWEIFAKLNIKNEKLKVNEFLVKLIKIDDKKVEVTNKKDADLVVSDLKIAGYKVDSVNRREVRKNPYPPFTTSTMTQVGARLFSWSAKRTMNIAQKLYEEGLITYHRTDSTNIASSAIDKVRSFINTRYGKNYLPDTPRFYKTKSKVAQEAHEAIRPTEVDSMLNSKLQMLNDQKKLYDLIWRRFVACQMEASVYDETTIDVIAMSKIKNQKSNVYSLRASGQIMKFDGWRKVIPSSYEETPVLPLVEKDEALDLIKVISEQKFTQPPPRYNEASLIKTLEKLGIGRPSTYAPTITTIQIRYYVEKIEGKFQPTPIGVAVNDFLIINFPDIFDYSFTAAMEDDLDNIANGSRKWTAMMQEFYSPFEKKLEGVEEKSKRVKIGVEKTGKICPSCGKGELVVRIGRFGKFISCSRFPDCKFKERYIEKIGVKCEECKKGDVIVRKTKTGRKFYGCSRYPKCKWASWRKPGRAENSEERNKNSLTV